MHTVDDASCILSTMHFVCNQAVKYKMVPVLTFDQPLYWKAMEIILSEGNNSRVKGSVLRSGGFHTYMSFLGAIGHLMQGSGLASIFDLIYAEATVPYMLCGKEVSRATRAHLILYANRVIPYFTSVLEHEERAVHDGRIGGEFVIIDISTQCGTMNIGIERIEVRDLRKLAVNSM